ncbi:hypothetical protein UF75_2486 [Desulfosporosinus sp. I2]|nr:hypothetical protein UF75_2486 [Desulfosporosinus sp. I2]
MTMRHTRAIRRNSYEGPKVLNAVAVAKKVFTNRKITLRKKIGADT